MKLAFLMILLGFNISTSWMQGLILAIIIMGFKLNFDGILFALNLMIVV